MPPPKSPTPRNRRRVRSPSPSISTDTGARRRWRRWSDLSVEVCKDFASSLCRRPDTDCQFAHPHSAAIIERGEVKVCVDALWNRCSRARTCRFYHPPPHIQESLLKAIGVDNAKVDMICRDSIRGRCLKGAKECRFGRHSSLDDNAVVCQDFIQGRCNRKYCRYSHVVPSQVCEDFLSGRCECKSSRCSPGIVRQTSKLEVMKAGGTVKDQSLETSQEESATLHHRLDEELGKQGSLQQDWESRVLSVEERASADVAKPRVAKESVLDDGVSADAQLLARAMIAEALMKVAEERARVAEERAQVAEERAHAAEMALDRLQGRMEGMQMSCSTSCTHRSVSYSQGDETTPIIKHTSFQMPLLLAGLSQPPPSLQPDPALQAPAFSVRTALYEPVSTDH